MAGSRKLYLLGALGLAGALLVLLKYTKGGREFLVTAVDSIAALPETVASVLASLGDWTRKIPDNLRGLFALEGAKAGMPPGLLEAVAYRESRFRQEIIDGRVTSSAGAVGIMQIVPKWHPAIGTEGARDPQRAIPYAANYLAALRAQFGSWRLALAAYNWGQGNLQTKDLADGIVGDDWPAETRAYVEEITRNAGIA